MKAGWQTSEFWLSLLTILLPALAQGFGASADPRLMAAGVALSGVYTVGRTVAKVASDVRVAAEAKAAVPPLPLFDADTFGGMTPTEKAQAIAAGTAAAVAVATKRAP